MTKRSLEVPLHALDPCFEGGVPASLATCAADGVPNVTFLSVVHRLDDRHVALSFQYFRKTKRNLAENPRARLLVIEPATGAEFSLGLRWLRTETSGPIFERLALTLSAVASQTGMTGKFQLRGADVYEVDSCDRVQNGVDVPVPTPSIEVLGQLARCTAALAGCDDLDDLLQRTLAELDSAFGYRHAFVMAVDEEAGTLFSLASRGYSPTGIGAEQRIGEGIIGLAAQRRIPVRIANMGREKIFADAVRGTQSDGPPTREIPLPGLPGVQSQVVVPVMAGDRLSAVLCVQSEQAAAFGRVDEDVLTIVAQQIGSCMSRFETPGSEDEAEPPLLRPAPAPGTSTVRWFAEDDSVFVDNEYVIKGVAGRILWLLLNIYQDEKRTTFTNREIRLDSRVRLPPVKDNLETRLIALRRRLDERCPQIAIHRTGRGRFELHVRGELQLQRD